MAPFASNLSLHKRLYKRPPAALQRFLGERRSLPLFIFVCIMLLVRLAAVLSFAVFGLSKPFNRPVVVPRQNDAPGAPLTPEQTVCGDIIVLTKHSKARIEVNITISLRMISQTLPFSTLMLFSNAWRAFPSTLPSQHASSTTTT